jgi:hypothetical protein
MILMWRRGNGDANEGDETMTTTTERMTWSEWNKVISGFTAAETWTCGRCLNQRSDLNVFIVGRVRFRADCKARTTIAELEADGWKKTHRLNS